MLYRGRELDPVALWERFVNLPPNVPASGFMPLVECPNPEHLTDKKHFQINLDLPLVHCFAGCGISGTYENAIAMIEGVTLERARRTILAATSISSSPTSKRKRRRVEDGAAVSRPDDKNVSRASLEFSRSIPGAGLDYLAQRGITGSSIASFGLGWDRDELRIVIPGKDERGTTRLLIKRAVREKDWPKYLYSDESSKTSLLFGACHFDRDLVRSEGIVLVEGSLDCIKLYQHDIRNAGAILGTYLSDKQAAIIARHRPRRIICMLDKDAAGARGVERIARYLFKYPIFVTLYPKGKSDPAELTREEAHRIIERAMPLEQFYARLPKRTTKERMAAHG